MTSEARDIAGGLDRALLVLLAETTDSMMALREILHSNPMVAKATRGCDIRKYRHAMTDYEDVYTFQAYVEVETRDGETFCWWLDITQGSLGWELQREVSKQLKDGQDVVREFEDCKFGSLDELVDRHADLMAEFVKSADNFDFK
jgi:hypothetical protein